MSIQEKLETLSSVPMKAGHYVTLSYDFKTDLFTVKIIRIEGYSIKTYKYFLCCGIVDTYEACLSFLNRK